MGKVSINTFSEGMMSDSDKSIRSKNSFMYAANLRYLANINSNTGTLHSVESSKKVANELSSNGSIIGHCVIRNYLVLFVSSLVTGRRYDRIYRYDITSTGLTNRFTVYYKDDIFLDNYNKTPEYLDTAGVYEDEDNIKVYWASSDKPLRVINITKYNSNSTDPDKFNIIPTASLSTLTPTRIVSGNLISGKVQYAYSFYKNKGQESAISSVTNPINIYSDNINTVYSSAIKGDSESKVSGKGVELNINTISSEDLSYFDKVRLYRVHYKQYGQLPVITIVNDFTLPSSGGLLVIDAGGAGLGTLTAEEFGVISGVQYNMYTIAEKDNILFGANVVEKFFDIGDFDTRAYRFKKSDQPVGERYVCRLYEDHSYTSPLTLTGPSPNYGAVPLDHNCINRNNDVTFDSTLATAGYYYQADGALVGGEGPNIKYEFYVFQDTIDTIGWSSSTHHSSLDGTYPILTSEKTGYQRGEVYRFGIIFRNNKGEKSSVKWVGDIRIPQSIENVVTTSGDKTWSQAVGIRFTTKQIPIGATSWEMVRVSREKKDRTVVTTGYGAYSYEDKLETLTTCKRSRPMMTDAGMDLPLGDPAVNKEIWTFVSPEEAFQGFSDIKKGDYISDVGRFTDYKHDTTYTQMHAFTSPSIPHKSIKYKRLLLNLHATIINSRTTVDDLHYIGSMVDPTQVYGLSKGLNGTYGGYIKEIDHGLPVNNLRYQGHGRCSVLQLTDALLENPAYENFDIPYVYITRVNNTRYGGYTLASKELNKYISCGSVATANIGASMNIFGGDTYINFFDYLSTIYVQEKGGATIPEEQRLSLSVLFPTESPINTALRYDDNYAKVYSNSQAYLMTEYAGNHIHTNPSRGAYIQASDLYLYNTVYSQEGTAQVSFSAELADLDRNLDSRVVHSDTKIQDEPIDSWSKFRPNNFLDVSSAYGAIKSLKKFNNNLYFIQDNAFGYLAVNQRALITDNNPGSLALGTGGTLSRYEYLDEYSGTQHKKSVATNNTGLYFADKSKKAVAQFNNNGFNLLNNTLHINTYLKELTYKDIPFVTASSLENEVYFQLSDNVLVYNTIGNVFLGEHTFNPGYIASTRNFTFYMSGGEDIQGLYLGADYGSFDGGVTYNDSIIRVLNAEDFYHTKTYSNIVFFTNTIQSKVEQNTSSFDFVSLWNDYQYTSKDLQVPDAFTKRERGTALAIPRNLVLQNGTTNIDIFNPINHDVTREFREKMRDKYIISEFIYKNSINRGQISVPYISFLYNYSKR